MPIRTRGRDTNRFGRNGILVSMLRFLFGGFFGAVVGGFLDWFNSSEKVG